MKILSRMIETRSIGLIAGLSGIFLIASGSCAFAQTAITATPTLTPGQGRYMRSRTVTISDATPGAAIYYTTDETTPTTNSTVYTAPITVSGVRTGPEWIEAIAIAPGDSQSAVGSAAYLIGRVAPPSCSDISLGSSFDPQGGPSLHGFVPFPSNNAWNTNIVSAPVDPNSQAIIVDAGFIGTPQKPQKLHPDFGAENIYGIPYVVVDSTRRGQMSQPTPTVPINVIDYPDESDVAVAPFPLNAPIEGGPAVDGGPADCSAWPDTYVGDAHVLVLDRGTCQLYETFNTNRCDGLYDSSSETIWDMKNGEHRPWTWTSADAAGLSVFAGLIRYDEVASGAIHHAIRFTLPHTRTDADGEAYFVNPATHAAGGRTTSLDIMGMRIRLKATYDISGFSKTNQVILTAMQQYGLILADNGSGVFFQGASDPRFNDDDLGNLKSVPLSEFEVVKMSPDYPGYDPNLGNPDLPPGTPGTPVPTGNPPTIHSFSSSLVRVRPGTPVTFYFRVSGDSYDYIDGIGPVRTFHGFGIVTAFPKTTQTYTLYSTNAYGRTASIPILVKVPGSVVATPVFTPVAGSYSATTSPLAAAGNWPLAVSISTPTSPFATIYYTTDGTTPTTSSAVYSSVNCNNICNPNPNAGPGGIIVQSSMTVKAIAVVPGYTEPSAVGAAAYIITP